MFIVDKDQISFTFSMALDFALKILHASNPQQGCFRGRGSWLSTLRAALYHLALIQ